MRYIRGCVEPSIADLSPSNPAILITDGHGSHFTLELLTYCRSIGLHILLRPPHTTHILQGEDVQHFMVFKPAYHQAKMLKIQERALCGTYKLRCSDLLACAKGLRSGSGAHSRTAYRDFFSKKNGGRGASGRRGDRPTTFTVPEASQERVRYASAPG